MRGIRTIATKYIKLGKLSLLPQLQRCVTYRQCYGIQQKRDIVLFEHYKDLSKNPCHCHEKLEKSLFARKIFSNQ